MTHPFELALPSGQKIGKAIIDSVLKAGIDPVIVDIGARSGMFSLPGDYASLAKFVGFEPNEAEYKKLVDEKTDSMLASGLRPRFKSKIYFNCAVWDKEEERDFYITTGAGACTMMGPTDPKITGRMFLEASVGTHQESYLEQHTAVVETVKIKCDSLDALLDDDIVDFLKIDVEGAEIRVLQGADNLFSQKKALFIKTEFVGFSYYQEHPLLSQQHTFLTDRGYRLLRIDLDHQGYSRSPSNIPSHIDNMPCFAGDAYFILDPDRKEIDPISLHRMAAICLALGFRSFAVSLLRDAKIMSPQEIDGIEAVLARVPLRKKTCPRLAGVSIYGSEVAVEHRCKHLIQLA
ncbi:MAG TPA: FkbM family methyltransferase [Rhodospirillales bacterium]|nr:FkbM family methyltransferase [Rhodospirillales bacterium]